jgi:hypothetical protein
MRAVSLDGPNPVVATADGVGFHFCSFGFCVRHPVFLTSGFIQTLGSMQPSPVSQWLLAMPRPVKRALVVDAHFTF